MNPGMVKIRVPLPNDAWHGVSAERLWAEPIVKDLVRVQNIPAFAMGIAVQDVVRIDTESNDLNVLEVVQRSGRSVLHIVFADEPVAGDCEKLADDLKTLGCRVESSEYPFAIIGVDVPVEVDLERIRVFLSTQEESMGFEFLDACNSPRSD